ncbi:MAG: hypothetical protein ACOVRB_04700 [Akkermansiaceae bacterium]
MRIPWYACLPLILLTVGLVWWQGSQDREFVTPPSDDAIAQIKEQTKNEIHVVDSILPPEPDRAIRVKPKKLVVPEAEKDAIALLKPEEIGHPSITPGIDCYRTLAGRGAVLLSDLANQLESRGETQRALLAWERIIDSSAADSSQLDTARKAVQRLRTQVTPWNVDPTSSVSVVLHANCDRERGKSIESILREVVTLFNQAGSGLFELKLKVQTISKPAKGAPPLPVALWFSSATSATSGSKAVSIPLATDSPEEQKKQLLVATCKLLREGARGIPGLKPLAEPSSQDPLDFLETAVTRRTWEMWSQTFLPKKP